MVFYNYSSDSKDYVIYEKVISPCGAPFLYIMSNFNTRNFIFVCVFSLFSFSVSFWECRGPFFVFFTRNSKLLPGCLSWKYSLFAHYLHSQAKNSSATGQNSDQPALSFSATTQYWTLRTALLNAVFCWLWEVKLGSLCHGILWNWVTLLSKHISKSFTLSLTSLRLFLP